MPQPPFPGGPLSQSKSAGATFLTKHDREELHAHYPAWMLHVWAVTVTTLPCTAQECTDTLALSVQTHKFPGLDNFPHGGCLANLTG